MKTPVCVSDRIHVVNTPVWSVLSEIAQSGLQDDAFFVCDLGDIVNKYREWRHVMPRVEPHYGKYTDIFSVPNLGTSDK